jgi:hypothetical protein
MWTLITYSRWVFIIEGVMSVVIVPMIWFGLASDPSKAFFLNESEKEIMRIRDAQRAEYIGNEEFSWQEVKLAFRDPKIYLRYYHTLGNSRTKRK